MKLVSLCVVFLLLLPSGSRAQDADHPPFIFTAIGGLFFPANDRYSDVFHSNSDLLWGFGASFPVEASTFIAGDMTFFKSEAFLDPAQDSTISLQEKFIHIGLLNKQRIVQRWFVRFSGGLSYTFITEHVHGASSPELSIEAQKKIGYYGGIGVEHLFGEGHFSISGDMVYDYRRVQQKDLDGDFGGLRLVVGINMYAF